MRNDPELNGVVDRYVLFLNDVSVVSVCRPNVVLQVIVEQRNPIMELSYYMVSSWDRLLL